MDGNLAGLIFLGMLLFGKMSLDGRIRKTQWERDKEETKIYRATIMERIDAMESKLDREYLLRAPHLLEHDKLNQRMRDLADQVRGHDASIRALQNRKRP